MFTLGRVFPLCQINGGFCCGSGRVRIGFGSGSGFAVLDNIFVIFIICLSFFSLVVVAVAVVVRWVVLQLLVGWGRFLRRNLARI